MVGMTSVVLVVLVAHFAFNNYIYISLVEWLVIWMVFLN